MEAVGFEAIGLMSISNCASASAFPRDAGLRFTHLPKIRGLRIPGRVNLSQASNKLQFSPFYCKSRGGGKFGVNGKAGPRSVIAPRCSSSSSSGSRDDVSTIEKATEKDTSESSSSGNGTANGNAGNGSASVQPRRLWDELPKIDRGEDGRPFNWLAHWYPVGVLKHMDKTQPHAVTILGRDLVMWWDRAGGEWQVFADACPHRQAPLSEGRIDERGHLQCSYHGWAFAPKSGNCTLIPQAPPDKQQVKESKRACATVYISKEHQGMLFVYMDSSEGAKERAEANPPPVIPSLDDPEFVYDIGMSDLYYTYESLIENLLDPAHAPFAHHKLLGTRANGVPLDFRMDQFGKDGFVGSRGGYKVTQKFIAPCLAASELELPALRPNKKQPFVLKKFEQILHQILPKKSPDAGPQKKIWTVFYCVPMTPEKSRVLFAFPRNFAKTVFRLYPLWLAHQLQMTILDSDAYFLNKMERKLEEGGGLPNIEKLFYTPTASDAFVIGYRRWLKKFGGAPDYGAKAVAKLPPTAPRRAVLDRDLQHVKYCTYCSGALQNFKALEVVLHVLPFALVGLVAASNSKPLRGVSSFSVPLICVAIVSALASRWLSSWIKKNYEFHDYNHALVK